MAIPLSRSLCASAGHSYSSQGAVNGELEEHYFNVLMCEYLMAEMRVAQIPCDIVDPFENNLIRIGSSALDHYCFIEAHLNSSTVKSINYAVGCTDTRFSNRISKIVAAECAVAIGGALNIPVHRGEIVGLMQKELAVLKAASHTNCPISFIIEPFFLSHYTDKSVVEKNCKISMQAVAKVLLRYFKA